MNLPKIAPNCMTARVLLAFLATAGLYYVNIMPAVVDGLKVGLGFTNRDAGLVGSANMYGAACGAFIVAFFIRRLNWRLFAHFFLFCLIAFDAISIFVTDPFGLMSVRFVHGFFGGALVGLGFSIMARTEAPDRTFGMLLLVQALAGGLGVMTLPLLVPHFGTQVLFIALILFSCITLLFLQFLPDYPHIVQGKQDLVQT
ncbi:MAG: MFS transporter, partial [Pseudomonadota bacterium]